MPAGNPMLPQESFRVVSKYSRVIDYAGEKAY